MAHWESYETSNLTVKSCAEACRAPVMQSIVLLIVLLCFQVELDWFTEPPAEVQLCRSRLPYFVVCSPYCTKAPRTLPEPWRHSDGVLKNLWAPCPYRRGSTVLWCCRRWPMGAKLRRSATLIGTTSLPNIWNRIEVANWPSKSQGELLNCDCTNWK